MGRKLAIIGGGGHGKVVKEVAESMLDEDGNDLYASIIFLDDKAPVSYTHLTLPTIA